MDSKLSRWCEGVLEAAWLTAVISVPLFFNIHSDRVFEPDKLTLLRSIALVALAAWLVRFIDRRGWQDVAKLRWRHEASVWKRPFVLPVTLIVLLYLITTLTSVSPRVSWAGSYQRLQGTYTTLSYIIIFFVIISTMRSRPQLRRLITFIVITSIPIAFYGLLQHFALDPLPWGGNVTERVAGHMGNAIFIAAYLIMIVPLTLAQILDAFTRILRDDEMSYADVVRSSIYIFTLAIQLLTIYWSGSRGPWIGLFVGLFAFTLILLVTLRDAAVTESKTGFQLNDAGKALLFLLVPTPLLFFILRPVVRSLANVDPTFGNFIAFAGSIGLVTVIIFVMMGVQRGWKWLWLTWILLAVFTASWLVMFNFAEQLEETPVIGGIASELADWKELPRIGRLGRLLESDSGTGRVRVLIWSGALDLISASQPIEFPDGSRDSLNILRPLIGYGPESMYVAYNQYYPPELATLEARNASPDRSHNETFDALVITGGLGFIVWQILYLSVFYYGLTWLGVVKTRRDSIFLVAFWLGGALLLTLLIISTLGAEFLGVAIPLGSIVGLVLYLITYAIISRPDDETGESDPFAVDRLLLLAMLSGIVAHYVEIHFGIAIAASRVHFFVFVALMAMIGNGQLAGAAEKTAVSTPTPAPTKSSSRKGRKGKRSAPATRPPLRGWFSPALLSGLLLSLIVGILAFNYTTYALPPGVELTSPDDLGMLEIIRQSLLVNVQNEFRPSPFIFLLIILSWLLGVLLIVSEMVKSGDIGRLHLGSATKQENSTLRVAAAVLILSGLFIFIFRLFVSPPDPQDPTQLLGRSMSTIWLALTLWAAVLLFLERENGRLVASLIALLGLLMVPPLLLAGGSLYALLLFITCTPVLYLTAHRSIAPLLYPAAVVGAVSIFLGLGFTLLHGVVFRSAILAQPTFALESVEDLLRWRVLEAGLAGGILTLFYLFVFVLLLLGGTAVATPQINRVRQSGWGVAFASLAILFLGTAVTIDQSNLQVVQADMIYKRGKPFDSQATRQRDVQSWDTAIAIYEETVDLAPREDFYYLFLGRAYLERSTITEDPIEQQQLLAQAEERLLTAQSINPLNTDHTANLARLNTRWLQFGDGVEREARFAEAEAFYQDALALSPQNSLIRNEYARLLFDLEGDCEAAAAVYEASIEIDPFFADTYFGYADLNVTCAATAADEAERREFYETAVSLLEEGLTLNTRFDRAWLQVAQLYQELGEFDQAIEAFEEVRSRNQNDRLVAGWNLDYLLAGLYSDSGNTELAATFGQQALSQAPAEVRPQIQELLNELGVEGIIPLDPPETEAPTDLGEPVELGEERPLASLPPAQRNNFYSSYPPTVIDTSKEYEAIITTENGTMRFALFDDEAPLTVNNFVFLAQQGFYDNTTFHRVLADFMAQAGDPLGVGTGGPGYQFADETNNGLTFNKRGQLAMANAGPGTNGSQFFITFIATEWLTGNHTIFGELVEGDAVLSAISLRDPAASSAPGDALISIDIIETP